MKQRIITIDKHKFNLINRLWGESLFIDGGKHFNQSTASQGYHTALTQELAQALFCIICRLWIALSFLLYFTLYRKY